ncbi:MAG: B12-binding domain-containing radical SAM protein [Desulfobacterales bacterium]|nr:B12-binding domain-containing radical SAM protein [Desulfobacterales bacterium]
MKPIENLLLVYPKVPSNTYWSYRHCLAFLSKESAHPPLGLITVAAYLDSTVYHLKLVDMNIEPLLEKDLKWADAVFASAMIVQKASLEQVIASCNRIGVPVIAGGPYVTTCPESIQGADHVLPGEVDETLADFMAELQTGRAKREQPMPKRPDITNLPPPRFDLLNMNAYASMAIQYSRGCPFQCEFCDIWKIYGNRPRLKAAETVLEELTTLYELGWRGSIFVVDDNFIGNKKRVKSELLPAVTAWQKVHGNVFQFYTEASINLAQDEALLAGMRDAGFNGVFVGIETPSEASLKETGKLQNLKSDMLNAVFTIQRYGIEVMAGFILGFDSDTEDIFDQQIAFIQQSGIPRAMVGLLSALPGTELYERLKQEGRIIRQADGNNTHCMSTNFYTKMDPRTLKEGYRRVLASIYDLNLKNYFRRCNRLIKNLGNVPRFSSNIRLQEIRILLRSLLRQPFTPYGYQFVKFAAVNFFRGRRFFHEAIMFGVIGHHYHRITWDMIKVEALARDLDRTCERLRRKVGSYKSRFLDNSEMSMRKMTGLWKERNRALIRVQRRMEKVNDDFKAEFYEKYVEAAKQMRELILSFEKELLNAGG